MKLKKKYQVSALVSSVLLLIAAFYTILELAKFNDIRRDRVQLEELVLTVTALKQIAFEYDPDVGTRYLQQWDVLQERVTISIQHIDEFETFGIGYYSELETRLETISTLFDRVLELHDNNQITSRLGRTVLGRLGSQADSISIRLQYEIQRLEDQEAIRIKGLTPNI